MAGSCANVADSAEEQYEDFEDEEICPQDLRLEGLIGEGTTATVYLAQYRGEQVAVKEIRVGLEEGISEGIRIAAQRELRVLSQVRHDNILRFIGLVSETTRLRFVLEYCAGGSLFEHLHNRWDIPVSWTQRFKMLLDTSSAQAYLHTFDPPILHRDLKSLNLMLKHEIKDECDLPVIKLADFGFARVQEGNMTQCVGTKHWMAPEVINSTDYTQKADVFSFAMVAYEVCCRHVAFEELDATSVARMIIKGERPDLSDDSIVPSEAPSRLLQLIALCWAQDPAARPSFDEVYQITLELSESTVEHYSF